MSVVALVVGLVSGPGDVLACPLAPLTAWLRGEGSEGLTILLGVVGLVLPIVSLILARRALREIDHSPSRWRSAFRPDGECHGDGHVGLVRDGLRVGSP